MVVPGATCRGVKRKPLTVMVGLMSVAAVVGSSEAEGAAAGVLLPEQPVRSSIAVQVRAERTTRGLVMPATLPSTARPDEWTEVLGLPVRPLARRGRLGQ